MDLSLTINELKNYVEKQIETLIPDALYKTGQIKDSDIISAVSKCDYCFSHIKNGAFNDGKGKTFFSHVHADQYAMFLVYLSNYIWKERQDKIVCDRIMYLNRILHSFLMSYKAKVPDIFWLAHPVGSVIGNADYSDYLYISQNCTINTAGTADELKPHIGKFFSMGAGAAVIGDKPIGDNCSIGVNAVLYDTELKDNSIVINNNGNIEIKKSQKISFAKKVFIVSD